MVALGTLVSCSQLVGDTHAVDEMYIESCSLGCSTGDGPFGVSCVLVNTEPNRDIALRFSEPLDPLSINRDAFRVVEAGTGISPAGQLIVDPRDAHRLLFRPALTFDGAGGAVFGLRGNVPYRISVAGELQGDPGPYLRSQTGAPNRSRMDCTIIPDQGALDYVPGPPTLQVFADVATAWNAAGEPIQFQEGVLLTRNPGDVTNVYRRSPLRFVFADVMSPAKLANNNTGLAPLVRVEVDGDGLLGTTADRSLVPGRYDVSVDLVSLTTELIFTPSTGFPSSGGGSLPRAIVVTVPEAVTDLLGEPLVRENGGGQLAFTAEEIEFTEQLLPGSEGVTFAYPAGDPESWNDPRRTGALWGEGRLAPGFGGGSGRLGELTVRAGETLQLNTDSQVFPLEERAADVLGNGGDSGPSGMPHATLVTDGVFELASLEIEAGGRLLVRGNRAARLLVSGPVTVHSGGLLDIAGTTPSSHDGTIALPELGIDVRRMAGEFTATEVATAFGSGGPGGGDGGFGGDRHDFGPFPEMLSLGGGSDARDLTGFPVRPNGRFGQGVGRGPIGGGAGGRRVSHAYPERPSTIPCLLYTSPSPRDS